MQTMKKMQHKKSGKEEQPGSLEHHSQEKLPRQKPAPSANPTMQLLVDFAEDEIPLRNTTTLKEFRKGLNYIDSHFRKLKRSSFKKIQKIINQLKDDPSTREIKRIEKRTGRIVDKAENMHRRLFHMCDILFTQITKRQTLTRKNLYYAHKEECIKSLNNEWDKLTTIWDKCKSLKKNFHQYFTVTMAENLKLIDSYIPQKNVASSKSSEKQERNQAPNSVVSSEDPGKNKKQLNPNAMFHPKINGKENVAPHLEVAKDIADVKSRQIDLPRALRSSDINSP